jgi:hypothetical protein
MAELALRPITRSESDEFIIGRHRHHRPPVGALWRHAVHDDDGVLVGVAVIGRPVAREIDDGLTGGRSLLAAGYRYLWIVRGRSWDTPGRPRTDKHPTEDKVALGWGAWPTEAGRRALDQGGAEP